jgi:hypothetical protein
MVVVMMIVVVMVMVMVVMMMPMTAGRHGRVPDLLGHGRVALGRSRRGFLRQCIACEGVGEGGYGQATLEHPTPPVSKKPDRARAAI